MCLIRNSSISKNKLDDLQLSDFEINKIWHIGKWTRVISIKVKFYLIITLACFHGLHVAFLV